MPSGQVWRIGCSCGWAGEVSLAVRRARGASDIQPELDRLFVAHVPEAERQTYVMVDQRPVPDPADPDGVRTLPRGNWIMPEGVPCRFDRHWEDDGIRYVHVITPHDVTLPLGEIWLEDGRYFRTE